jgi:hypothetical protein
MAPIEWPKEHNGCPDASRSVDDPSRIVLEKKNVSRAPQVGVQTIPQVPVGTGDQYTL